MEEEGKMTTFLSSSFQYELHVVYVIDYIEYSNLYTLILQNVLLRMYIYRSLSFFLVFFF
jgi:hypothetical protein